MKDEMKAEEYHIREGTPIEMTLRLQGGTKDEEMKNSAGTSEERQVRRRTFEPCSEISGNEEMKLGDVTDLIKRKLKLPKKRSDQRNESASKRSSSRKGIANVFGEFYSKLCAEKTTMKSTINAEPKRIQARKVKKSEDNKNEIPEFSKHEIRAATESLKKKAKRVTVTEYALKTSKRAAKRRKK